MECSGYSSPRSDSFPAGLRVLVVDDDLTWLKILEKMLKKCSYEVTTCGLARVALDLLRERKDGFDIVISDVNMPDMDGFKLLEHVGLEMDLPVIMMSVDGETSRVMKGVQHGACDYLLKPIRMKELRNIWQHVFRKRIHEVRDTEGHEGLEEIQFLRNGTDHLEDGYWVYANDPTSGKKRKDFENKHDGREYNDPSSAKKTRVVWTVDLHQKFVKAVNQIGLEKVGPKKILDLMGVPWLTRENVASHLQGPITDTKVFLDFMNHERSLKDIFVGQKYRLYLSRLQKGKELAAYFCGMKNADISSKEHSGSHCPQNPTNKQQGAFTNGNCSISANSAMLHNVDFEIQKDDTSCSVPKAVREPTKASNGQNLDPQKNRISGTSLEPSLGQSKAEVNFVNATSKLNSWNAELQLQLEPDSSQLLQPMNCFNLLQIPTVQPSIKLESAETGPHLKSKPVSILRDIAAEEKPSHVNSRSHGIGQLPPKISTTDLCSVLSESQLTGQALEPQPSTSWTIKSQTLDQIPMADLNFGQRLANLASLTDIGFWDESPQGCSFQDDFQPIESSIYTDPEVNAEVPACWYDSLKFNYDCPLESLEYSVIDHGLFIV